MLKIKLRKVRSFSKKRFVYHIVVIKSGHKVSGKARERLGFYEPIIDTWTNAYLFLKTDRLYFWLKRGAKLEPRTYKLLAPLLKLPG